jgi:predicted deacylase
VNHLPPFKTGKARAEKGHFSPLPELILPYAVIEGAEAGPRLLVTGGVHGAEFCSIEAALRLSRTDPKDIKGTIVVLPILNVQGFKARSIAVMPEDGKNLNRAFPGRPDGTVSERLAAWLVQHVFPNVDAYLDLHGGDLTEEILPITIFPRGSDRSKDLATAFGLQMIVEASAPSSTTVTAAADMGVPSAIVEIGGNGLWNEAQLSQFAQGIHRVMAHLGIRENSLGQESKQTPQKVDLRTVSASKDGIWYPAKRLSDSVHAGEVIGEIRDAFGSALETIRSEVGGVVLYRLTSLSVNKDETLYGIGGFSK